MNAGGLVRLAAAPLRLQCQRQLNCNRAAVARVHRTHAARLYPTTVVLSDGSTILARYHEPRKIIKLPLDLSTLSESARALRLLRRKPRQKVALDADVEDSFDSSQYRRFWKR